MIYSALFMPPFREGGALLSFQIGCHCVCNSILQINLQKMLLHRAGLSRALLA